MHSPESRTSTSLYGRWREALTGVQSGRPEQVLRLFVGNPFRTVSGVAKELDVAYTTARRAIDRLEEAGIVSLVGAARRNRVYWRAGHAGSPRSPPCGRPEQGRWGCQGRCRMSAKVSERAFEDAIEAALLRHGPDEIPAVAGAVAETPPPYGDPDMRPGRLPPAAGGGLRPCALPPAGRCRGLRACHPAEGVAAAVGAPWRCGEGAVSEAPLVRD